MGHEGEAVGTASGTDGFAALLRTLKTRSGLSYGALAKRLHMSTSTLHRYCNGDAVPTDYAPVERLARVCGAKPEELVELHRQWILADAARGRRTAEAGTVAETGPAAEAAPEPEAAVPEPADADPVEPTPAPVPTTREPTSKPTPAPTPKPTPKLRLALAAAAVVALAVPVAVAVTSSGADGGGTGTADARVAERPGQGGRGPATGGGTSGSPSATASSGTSDEPTRGSLSPTPSPNASTPGGGAGGDEGMAAGSKRSSGTPLTADVRMNNWGNPCDRWYLLDKPPAKVPPPPSGPDARGWANALGAVPGGHLRISVAVQGTGDEAVVLHSLNVRTAARTPAPAGSAFSMGNGCGGGLTPASFDVALDAPQPLMRPVAGEQGDRKIPATDFPFKVSASDPQMLYVDAHTEANDVSWYLELEWSSGGRRGTLRLDDHGRPFRTSAMEGRAAYHYRHDQGVWEPAEY
ncbi:XRE family transcriptional regulator [Streptomyces albofaciens JCM 4342]|uniref:helix-turn-helix domain-containing protein n=1 Tax=Streptomyces albofaciens TaxID=66866 RepID=UPI00123C4076|nr:helix-turn-helix transcriptional regulator [Streptomyces albofaciens]KAA6221029.1 XRE family transcriptional regulator [Streptomyces albofaciens JCM 4342]